MHRHIRLQPPSHTATAAITYGYSRHHIWPQACFDKCVSSVKRCLKGAGYDLEREIVFVPVSALSATNLLERSDTLPWYKGPTFIEVCVE